MKSLGALDRGLRSVLAWPCRVGFQHGRRPPGVDRAAPLSLDSRASLGTLPNGSRWAAAAPRDLVMASKADEYRHYALRNLK
jgi:hypothetical protein